MARHGPKPGSPGYKAPSPVIERLRARTVVTETGCWVWQGATNQKGYGTVHTGSRIDGTRRNWPVHRAAYEALVGPIPDGLTIDHLCENKKCWNPDHLEPVTNAENTRRWAERMTHCRHGHERNEANTYVYKGGRQCRPCRQMRREWERELRRARNDEGRGTKEAAA